MGQEAQVPPPRRPWRALFARKSPGEHNAHGSLGHPRWRMGILEDKHTTEVPGSVLLLATDHRKALGLRNAPAGASHSSILGGITRQRPAVNTPGTPRKMAPDGETILVPQPEDSVNDPLNWPAWRRDLALLSLGFLCMVGGGTGPLLAAGFAHVAEEYGVDVLSVSHTTGLYLLGMGLGSVVFSPTAILWGKRPVYLCGAVLYLATSVWCAASPNFTSLVVARTLQGVAVSPVECLPSATIAELFFLHERAFRIGIYTLLLLGGRNLVRLVTVTVIQNVGWRWIFWIVAMVAAFCGLLVFFFVPETFWDRGGVDWLGGDAIISEGILAVDEKTELGSSSSPGEGPAPPLQETPPQTTERAPSPAIQPAPEPYSGWEQQLDIDIDTDTDTDSLSVRSHRPEGRRAYTPTLREQPQRSFVQSLKPYNGRLSKDKWHKVAIRPLILMSYPAVLWSAVVYACSVGWLIVICESVAFIYSERIYHLDPIQIGFVYISPFVGGILGSAVAGRVSDFVVRAMARRNGGRYEPEFRLVMAIPVTITTVLGLMAFGWSAQIHDHWIVPTAFFGVISFGCTMGSTVSITFCVDSYREYAGEALVTLNFTKNVLHGFVFSLFISRWLSDEGPKIVYIWIGVIQLIVLIFTIPLYIFGKRLRMWTVRNNFIERF